MLPHDAYTIEKVAEERRKDDVRHAEQDRLATVAAGPAPRTRWWLGALGCLISLIWIIR